MLRGAHGPPSSVSGSVGGGISKIEFLVGQVKRHGLPEFVFHYDQRDRRGRRGRVQINASYAKTWSVMVRWSRGYLRYL